ncbi:hypothetical protein [Hydrogenophaga sp. 5NK40-0174]|uniref:hypothetical protein n=1 Tax=Hydrogenophaga sp. 5NK40-0174 TaxID=3127649 RepID=UPI00310ADCD0
MQSFYPEVFERDMGTSEAEWVAAMPRAIGDHPWQRRPDGAFVVEIGSGQLEISWTPLPERRIALLVMKRLLVRFAFEGLDEAQRLAFMKPFDLTIQRGGG